jgi:hypothetical protein
MTWATNAVNGSIPGCWVAATVDGGPVDVVGGQVGQRAAAVVVVADPHHPGLAWGQTGVAPSPSLNGGLLVGGDHIVVY